MLAVCSRIILSRLRRPSVTGFEWTALVVTFHTHPTLWDVSRDPRITTVWLKRTGFSFRGLFLYADALHSTELHGQFGVCFMFATERTSHPVRKHIKLNIQSLQTLHISLIILIFILPWHILVLVELDEAQGVAALHKKYRFIVFIITLWHYLNGTLLQSRRGKSNSLAHVWLAQTKFLCYWSLNFTMDYIINVHTIWLARRSQMLTPPAGVLFFHQSWTHHSTNRHKSSGASTRTLSSFSCRLDAR